MKYNQLSPRPDRNLASPIPDKLNLPSGSGPDQALEADVLDAYWHFRGWRMGPGHPMGWIEWLAPPAARFGTRSQAPSVAILRFPVPTPNPPIFPCQDLLVFADHFDLATCSLRFSICDCDWRLATWQLGVAADNSLVGLLSADCPEPGALHRTVRPLRRRWRRRVCELARDRRTNDTRRTSG